MVEAPKPPQKLLPSPQESAGMSLLSNTLAVIGFIILIVIVVWGLLHIVSLSSFSLGSWLNSSPKSTVTAPKNATAGTPTAPAWKNIQTSAGAPAQQPVVEKPAVKKTTPAYSYSYGAQSSSGLPAAGGQSNLVAHAASGPADLSVHIITIGVIDPPSGALINRAPTSPNDIVAVEFDIANVGGTSTGSWYFQALLPVPPPNTYTSVAQISLKPGEHIVNTLRFSQAIPHGTFTVIADPINQVVESNKTNNTAATAMY